MFNTAFQAPFRAPFNAAAGIVYLLRDEFTTAEAAPIASPRTCEPGPGTLVVTDVELKASISGGVLVFASPVTPNSSELNLRSVVGFTRSCGLAYKINCLSIVGGAFPVYGWHGIASSVFSAPNSEAAISPGEAFFYDGTTATTRNIETGFDTTGVFYVVLRSTGAFGVLNNKLFVVWNIGARTPVYPWLSSYSRSGTFDDLSVVQLGAPWNTDYGIATNYIASAGIGQTTTMEANAIIESTWTAITGETYELSVRRTDDDNRWIIRCSQAGSTIKLIERNAGIETERSSAAQTWTNGSNYRIIVVCDTQAIKTFVSATSPVAKNVYASASFNQSATGIKTSHAVTNLVSWPRVLSGAALAALEAI